MWTPERARGALLWIATLACACVESSRGCDPGFPSQAEQLAFYEPTLIVGAEGYFENDTPVLVGTTICPRIDCLRPEAEEGDDPPPDPCPQNPDESTSNAALLACFSTAVEGAQVPASRCVTFSAPGTATWSFSPIPCDAQGDGFAPVPDEVEFSVRDGADLVAWFRPAPDLWALAEARAGPGEEFPTDAVRERGDPVRLLAPGPVRLPITLEDPDGTPVAWQVREPDRVGGEFVAEIQVEAEKGAPAVVELLDVGTALVSIEPGARSRLRLTGLDHEYDLGEVEGVAASAIESLELVVAYAAPSPDEPIAPAGARAILRGGDGAAVYGGAIHWEVSAGRLGLGRRPGVDGQPDPEAADCEYMALAGDCYDPPVRETKVKAVLVARWKDLEDQEDLEWRIRPGGGGNFWEDFVGGGSGSDSDASYPCEGPGAVGGCGCTGTADGEATGPALLGCMAALRRRARATRAGSSRSTA